jgi:hypothetical protein
MHYKSLFNNYNNCSQEIFNRKLNWFFDIKYCLFDEETQNKISNKSKELIENYKNLKLVKKNKKKIIIFSKKINKKKYLKPKIFNIQLLKIIKQFQEKKTSKYFKHFLIQGSFSSNDYIENWSDFDSFVVLKNSTFDNFKNLLKLRVKLKKIYREILKICPYQHHGLIIYTEKDLLSYLSGFLPPAALKKNLNLIQSEKIFFNLINFKKNISKQILIGRLKYIKQALKNGKYNHHVFNKTQLTIPFIIGEKTLHQLFCHIGFMLNIPILFLDAINKSQHKKKSFQIFYKRIKNSQINNFIKKHEYIRKNWKNFYKRKSSKINDKIVKFLGPNYFNDCKSVIEKIIKIINLSTN